VTKTRALSPAAVLAAGLLALSCSGHSAEECHQAAVNQAFAEQHWQEEFEAHEIAHDTLDDAPASGAALDKHDHSAEALFSARVDMILADAETRRRCG